MEMPNPSRETKFSDANADRGISIFPVQLTTSRIGNLIQLIHKKSTLASNVTIHTCIPVYDSPIHQNTLKPSSMRCLPGIINYHNVPYYVPT